jgi:hypothetical protein
MDPLASDDDSNAVIANIEASRCHTACQIDMAGTTARRNVAATAGLQAAVNTGTPKPVYPPTLAASVAGSKAAATRRYERRGSAY